MKRSAPDRTRLLPLLLAVLLAQPAGGGQLSFEEALRAMGFGFEGAERFRIEKSYVRGPWAPGKTESYWTLVAAGAGAKIRLEAVRNLSEEAALRRMDDKFHAVENLFSGRAYYPGMAPEEFETPEPLRPRLFSPAPAGHKTLILYATEDFAYNVGAAERAVFRGVLTFRYCPRTETLIQIELFHPKREFSEALLVQELENISCRGR